ncbi:hypothetical protein GCM10022261_14120 [Brevibacterium daeguense]|uniref:beta-lactamase n=1 Tax=Brevibacterium daeguense TaxID=909936 RepID=A0ABP8EIV6_9MICO|nr:hypothetical protein [Brevibacterium daeguense]
MRMGRPQAMLAGIVLAVLALVIALFIHLDPELGSTPESAARRAAESLQDGAVAHGPWTDPAKAALDYRQLRLPLRATGLGTPRVVDVLEVEETGPGSAVATLSWGWLTSPDNPAGAPDWTYTTKMEVTKHRLSWRAVFEPSAVHPRLTPGARFAVSVTPAERGQILSGSGEALTSTDVVVEVGIEPSRVEDLDALLVELARHLDVDVEALRARVERAAEHDFVPVITLRESDYLDAAAQIRLLPGTVFRKSERSIPFEQGFAPVLLGSVGEATAEEIHADPARVHPGELVGRGGLQEHCEQELAGIDGYELRVEPQAGGDEDSDEPVLTDSDEPVLTVDPRTGRPVRTTIDIDVQQAVDRIVADSPGPAGMVVVDSDTGHVFAVGSGGAGSDGFDRALLGDYTGGPGTGLAGTLAEVRGASGGGALDQAVRDLGMAAVDIGLPAVAGSASDEIAHSSPLTTAVAAASVHAGEVRVPQLVTEAGGREREPAAVDGGIAPEEAAALQDLAEGVFTAPGSGWVLGETAGLVFALVIEGADESQTAESQLHDLAEQVRRDLAAAR